jgi:hypothetical protein
MVANREGLGGMRFSFVVAVGVTMPSGGDCTNGGGFRVTRGNVPDKLGRGVFYG